MGEKRKFDPYLFEAVVKELQTNHNTWIVDAYVLTFTMPTPRYTSFIGGLHATAKFLSVTNGRSLDWDDDPVRIFYQRLTHEGDHTRTLRVMPDHLAAAKQWISDCGWSLDAEMPEEHQQYDSETLYLLSKMLMIAGGVEFPSSLDD